MTGLLPIIVIEAVAALVCIEILMRNMPSAIRASIAANARRLDGTWSRAREQVEERALWRLRRGLCAAFLLILVPGNLLVYAVHVYVIPLPIGVDAAANFRLPVTAWKQSLREEGVERHYDRWHKSPNALNKAEVGTMKQFLWRSWPLIVGILAAWVVVSFLVLKSLYVAALRELVAGIQSRAEQYRFRDLARSG